MVGLATEFLAHSRQWSVEPDLVERIMGEVLDVEHLIEGLDRICQARTSLEAIGEGAVGFERVDKVRAEVEWFVQHAAERVAVGLIRSRGYVPKGGYDVPNGSNHTSAVTPAIQ